MRSVIPNCLHGSRRVVASGVRLVVAAAILFSFSATSSTAAPASQTSPALAKLTPALFAKLASGVVLIRGFDCSGTGKIEGTGFLVGQSVVMTARHVVDPAGAEAKFACRVKVHVDGHWVAVNRMTWWYNAADPSGRSTDLATLKLATPARDSDYIFDFRNTSPQPGTNLAMMGHPLGTEISLTQGRLLGRVRSSGHVPLLAIRMLGAEGSSGSPIMDDRGHVTGVLQLGLGRAESSGYELGIDLPSWWKTGHRLRDRLCAVYPNGGISGCASGRTSASACTSASSLADLHHRLLCPVHRRFMGQRDSHGGKDELY